MGTLYCQRENEKTEKIYCYRYNEETGEIKKYVIEDYTIIKNKYTGNKTYKFRKRLGTKTLTTTYLSENQLNRFVWNKVFTFEENDKKAKLTILIEIRKRIDEAEEKLRKAKEKENIFMTKNLEGDK